MQAGYNSSRTRKFWMSSQWHRQSKDSYMYRNVLACESDYHHRELHKGVPLKPSYYLVLCVMLTSQSPIVLFTEGVSSFCRKIRASFSSENHERPNFNVFCTANCLSGRAFALKQHPDSEHDSESASHYIQSGLF